MQELIDFDTAALRVAEKIEEILVEDHPGGRTQRKARIQIAVYVGMMEVVDQLFRVAMQSRKTPPAS